MPRSITGLCALVILVSSGSAAADTYPRQPGVDAVHYVFRLTLGDANNEIAGETTATLRITKPGITQVFLDLTSEAAGKGMTVTAVTSGSQSLRYAHGNDRLAITMTAAPKEGDEIAVTIHYRGVPAEGLRLINNIHGERSAFSENWPNRARQWLPTIDHPTTRPPASSS